MAAFLLMPVRLSRGNNPNDVITAFGIHDEQHRRPHKTERQPSILADAVAAVVFLNPIGSEEYQRSHVKIYVVLSFIDCGFFIIPDEFHYTLSY